MIDYEHADRVAQKARLSAWLQGLVDAEVDIIVFGWPPPPEATWLPQLKDILDPLARGVDGRSIAYHLDRETLTEP